jgi:hypothetical protein
MDLKIKDKLKKERVELEATRQQEADQRKKDIAVRRQELDELRRADAVSASMRYFTNTLQMQVAE